MKENLKKVECFEVFLQILSFCMKKWRTRTEVFKYLGLKQRTIQRHIKQLIEAGYIEERYNKIGATNKAYRMLLEGC